MSTRIDIAQYKRATEDCSWELPRPSHEAAKRWDYLVEVHTKIKGVPFRDWFNVPNVPKRREVRREQWFAERLRHAIMALRETIEVNPRKRGGVPVLRGTRVPVAQILAELADDSSVSAIADELCLDSECIRKLLEGIASYLDRPFFK